MAYIGNTPAEKFSAFSKQDFTTSATTSYTLDNPVSNANEIALFINHVRQEPTTAYTAAGTSLTLTSATTSSDDMYCVYLGKAIQTVNPANGSVDTAQLADNAVTSAKLGTGAILQVVSTTETSSTAITSLDTITEFISASITPISTSSKILITCNGVYGFTQDDSFGHILLFKGSSSLSGAIGDADSSAYRGTTSAQARTAGGATSNVARQFSFQYLDSPATTSATTYSGRAVATNRTTMYIGRSGTVSDDNRGTYITTLTLMEIAG